MLVKNAMVSDVRCCSSNASLEKIANLMQEYDCGSIPIVDGKEPIGIITDRDIALHAAKTQRPLQDITANELIKQQQVYCCWDDDPIEVALEKMENHQVRRLLVTDKERCLVGILSLGDITTFTANQRKNTQKTIPANETLILFKSVCEHHENTSTLSH